MTIQWTESVTMARVGTEKQRKQELIEATIKSIEDHGFKVLGFSQSVAKLIYRQASSAITLAVSKVLSLPPFVIF